MWQTGLNQIPPKTSTPSLPTERFMMIRFALMVCTLAVFTATADSASAHDPAQTAARCVTQINQIVDRCTNAAANETQECVRQINRLQELGRDEAAIQVAREFDHSARQRTRKCIAAIREICTECVDFLLNVGERDLAARVRWNCSDAISSVESILARETSAIQAALQD